MSLPMHAVRICNQIILYLHTVLYIFHYSQYLMDIVENYSFDILIYLFYSDLGICTTPVTHMRQNYV